MYPYYLLGHCQTKNRPPVFPWISVPIIYSNIAIYLFKLAIQDKFDKAYIISRDSDLIPSVEEVKILFPHKQIGVIIPIRKRAELLKLKCDFHMKIKEKHLKSSILPDIIPLKDNKQLVCPESWH